MRKARRLIQRTRRHPQELHFLCTAPSISRRKKVSLWKKRRRTQLPRAGRCLPTPITNGVRIGEAKNPGPNSGDGAKRRGTKPKFHDIMVLNTSGKPQLLSALQHFKEVRGTLLPVAILSPGAPCWQRRAQQLAAQGQRVALASAGSGGDEDGQRPALRWSLHRYTGVR